MADITADDITRYLDDQDDFDLELFVYRMFRERGVIAQHGGTYTDPHTGTPRQFDLRATIEQKATARTAYLAIECKSLSRERPLVVSRVPRPTGECALNMVRDHESGMMSETRAWQGPAMMYPAAGMVGKRTAQPRWDASRKRWVAGDAETYDRWSQALGSAAELVRSAANRRGVFSVVLPMLVVSDEALWVVDYDGAGNRGEPKQVNEATLYVNRMYPAGQLHGVYTITHLHIYTRRGFVSALDSMTRTINGMDFWDRAFGDIVGTAP